MKLRTGTTDNLTKASHLVCGRTDPRTCLLNQNPKFVPPHILSSDIHVCILFCKIMEEEKMVSGKAKHRGKLNECVFPFSLCVLNTPFLAISFVLQNVNIAEKNSGKLKVSNADSFIPLNISTVTPFDRQI